MKKAAPEGTALSRNPEGLNICGTDVLPRQQNLRQALGSSERENFARVSSPAIA